MRDLPTIRKCLLPAFAALTLLVGACGTLNEKASESGESARTVDTSAERSGSGNTARSARRIEVEVLAKGLEAPWGVAFLPGGDALVTERDTGRLLRVSDGGSVELIQRIPEGGSGEGGLLGLAISPDYERDKLVYVYYTTGADNRVGRFRLGEPPDPILTGIPVNTYHDGGGLAFGPDGMLYVTTGDAGDPETAQDKNSLSGKILRLTPDGGVPDDNPFPGNPTYSYGHRNVQGLAWDERGQLYASEFGQDRFDEVNRIEPGGNYGWPEVEGEGGEPEFIDPIQTFATDEASPSGAVILKDSAIPQWDGDFFMAALRGARLWRLDLGPEGDVTGKEALLTGEYGRLRNAVQAPDGSLWVFTNNRDGRGTPDKGD
ncbi:MAG TPA: PQQ-dependent sugar dehydrogenase, partial [Rubrobacteraceae bacterium]|nr:PQQ-dependent sugar dehydrogenase [Rubrobacteraceae bacterium]